MYNIKECRLRRNLSLTDLAKKTGLSLGYLCHLERGSRSNPSYNTMKKISDALDYNITEVFGV